jgi:retrograde regulation protein 2
VGVVEDGGEGLRLKANWDRDEKGRAELLLSVTFGGEQDAVMFAKELTTVQKADKTKHWVGGKDGVGHRVTVE